VTPYAAHQRTAMAALALCTTALAAAADPRLREVPYDPNAVVTVPVQRGVVTLIVLADDEAIQEVATGLGADCSKPDAVWCVAAQPGGRTLFVKPKSGAMAPNTLAVVTNARIHSFRLHLLDDHATGVPVYRLAVKAPPPLVVQASTPPLVPPTPPAFIPPPPPSPQLLVGERLRAKPEVRNAEYSLAEGTDSADIVPSLVFDDGRFTYFRFSGNREVPAVFQVLADGRETVVNARMEDDLLVADRVSRQLVLRSGSAVVGIWNEAYDAEGAPPDEGMTVAGVRRHLKASSTPDGKRMPGVRP
jgi:type IV secretion system protein VirB9